MRPESIDEPVPYVLTAHARRLLAPPIEPPDVEHEPDDDRRLTTYAENWKEQTR